MSGSTFKKIYLPEGERPDKPGSYDTSHGLLTYIQGKVPNGSKVLYQYKWIQQTGEEQFPAYWYKRVKPLYEKKIIPSGDIRKHIFQSCLHYFGRMNFTERFVDELTEWIIKNVQEKPTESPSASTEKTQDSISFMCSVYRETALSNIIDYMNDICEADSWYFHHTTSINEDTIMGQMSELQQVELLMKLETVLDCDIPHSEIQDWITMKNVIDTYMKFYTPQ